RSRSGPRPGRPGGTGRSPSGRSRWSATGSAAPNTGCRAATPTRPRPWTRWYRCRGRRRRWRSWARDSWAQFPGAAFDDPGRYTDPLDGKAGLAQPGQDPRRGPPPELVTGMVHDGDGRAQRIGHGEVAERDEADVR